MTNWRKESLGKEKTLGLLVRCRNIFKHAEAILPFSC